MATEERQWGLHKPLSSTLPTPEQISQNEAMIDELKRQNNFEASGETARREAVLKTFRKVTAEFVKEVGRKKGLPESQLQVAGGKVYTYGSYRLGVYGPGSDIDTLIVAPKHVSREEWFEHFPRILTAMSEPGAIEEMKIVKETFVPIIKLEYSGISIDLIFARLQIPSVPHNLELTDDNLLRDLDDVELRCVNGTRVTDMILNLVPQEATFRHTLRVIKLWAQRRAIYANISGFPGGVAWAMMVAFICQLYPRACGSVLVGKFFNLIRTWPWPRPIQLKQFAKPPPGMQHRVWNPVQYHGDKAHHMPIITPAYPEMCATHNITKSNKAVILKELGRAEGIMKEIYEGRRQWADLFQKHTFFTKDFRYYLSIVSGSKTKDAHLVWSGLVESKVRRLVSSIEMAQPNIQIARPYTKGFDRIHQCKNEEEIGNALHGRLDHLVKDSKSMNEEMAKDATHVAAAEGGAENGAIEMPKTGQDSVDASTGLATVYTTTHYVGIDLEEGAKSLDISHSVAEFSRQCLMWPQYDPNLSSIKVIHTRSYDLPDDVFEDGEVKPTKMKKSKAKSGVKRPNSEVDVR
ncbi:MAG: hypothetical protein Q9159_007266 [Coniocarpon cinnabarinum]